MMHNSVDYPFQKVILIFRTNLSAKLQFPYLISVIFFGLLQVTGRMF